MSYIESDRHNESDRRVLRGELDIPNADILYRKRACDADRDRYVNHLAECMRLGYITDDIFHARMGEAMQATTQDDLKKLLEDLPALTDNSGKFHPTKTQRRWLHIGGILVSILWAAIVPVTLWQEIGTSGIAAIGMWFFALTGIVGLIADIAWWTIWENASDYDCDG